jgi:AraC family transcriptional regulator
VIFMVRRAENPITFHALYHSPIVSVRDYRCRACRGGPEGEEHSGSDHIVLMRHGAFCKHFGRRSVTADVNQAVFFSKESTYRVSHPGECGDRGTVFAPGPRVLADILRELHASEDQPHEGGFPFVTGPCEDAVFQRHRDFVWRLEAAEPVEAMWADETALEIIADVLRAAFARHGLPRRAMLPSRRNGTDAAHADRAEAAKAYLAAHLGQRITLDDVARAVHTSPFHLARLFQKRAGVPVHRYLTRLRLRASLERLEDGAGDLTALALDLGFSSHSHFSDIFRREFGRTPSDVRGQAGPRTLREMSKNLEV